MAKTMDSHIVEIPINEENQISAIEHHPLAEISRSPGHFLLLKLWQREEDLYSRKLSLKESRMDSIKQSIFHLCCFFFIFHGLFFTILFTSIFSSSSVCKKWWIPVVLSTCSSSSIVFLVQLKLFTYWKVDGQLQRDRADCRALVRLIQELRMKGESFDLCKDPLQNGKKMKSSSVEIKWGIVDWCKRYRLTVCMLCFTGLAVTACRFMMCA